MKTLKTLVWLSLTATLLLLSMLLNVPSVSADALDTHCGASPRGRDACIKQIAIERNELDLCERITTQSTKNGCYYAFAISMKNMDLCRHIVKGDRGTERDLEKRYECFIEFVDELADLEICETHVNKERYHDQCIDRILDVDKTQLGTCDFYQTDEKKIRCYKKVAKAKKDVAICDKIIEGRAGPKKCQFISSRVCNQEEDQIDYQEEYEQCTIAIVGEDKAVGITKICGLYDETMEISIEKGERKELFFPKDHPRLDNFFFTHKWHDPHTDVVTIELDTGVERETFTSLLPGSTIIFLNDTGVQLLKTDKKEQVDDKGRKKMQYTAEFCLYKPSTRKLPGASSNNDDNNGNEENEDDEAPEGETPEERLERKRARGDKEITSTLDPQLQELIESFGGEDNMTLDQWAQVRELKKKLREEGILQKRQEAELNRNENDSDEDEKEEKDNNEATDDQQVQQGEEQETPSSGKKQIKLKKGGFLSSIVNFFMKLFGKS